MSVQGEKVKFPNPENEGGAMIKMSITIRPAAEKKNLKKKSLSIVVFYNP
jgi:hypothetical protein